MDFIDNLLNHMSSKFNQESKLPKQAEISMDETFKWRALKNNQFASRSKNRRSKIKSKDKGKHDSASSKVIVSYDENKKSDTSQDLSVADLGESTNIEIEIANDISGAEIQEVLASTQGNVAVLLDELKVVSLTKKNKTVSVSNDSQIVESSACTKTEHINDESVTAIDHSVSNVTHMQDYFSDAKKGEEDTEIVGKEFELNPKIMKHTHPEAKHIFIHMSSTFNGSCLPKSFSTDNVLQTQCLPTVNKQISSPNFKAPSNNDNASKNDRDPSSPTSVRRSKRLKLDHAKDPILADRVHGSNQQTIPLELASLLLKPANEMCNERMNNNDVSNFDKTDHTARTLRNRSFGIKLNEPEAPIKTAKIIYQNFPDMQESSRKVDSVKEQQLVPPSSKKVAKSEILQKVSKIRRTQHISKNFSTRQRNRNKDKKDERRKRSARFWNNAKNQTKFGKKTGKPKKRSCETKQVTASTKNATKQSVQLSRDITEGILVSAIARKEKNYPTGFQGRLSRPIKLSAKILANDELRYGFELQNSARLNLNAEEKKTSITKALLSFDEDSISMKTSVFEKQINVCIRQPNATFLQQNLLQSEPLSNVQTNYPDPLEFLMEIKRNNLGSNKSPECNSKLTKIQQENLLKLKEKHLLMLGLKKTNNKQSLADIHDKCIGTININKEIKNAHDNQIYGYMQIQSESSSNTLQTDQMDSKLLCFCQKDTRYFTTKTHSRMYCTATDDIGGQLIGCSNELKGGLQNLLRPSNSASYQLLCRTHQRRLRRHGCCATCGVYCTQGHFVICSNKHLFHRECGGKFIINTKEKSSPIIPKLVLKCPHCGLESVIREYVVRLQKNLSTGISTTRV